MVTGLVGRYAGRLHENGSLPRLLFRCTIRDVRSRTSVGDRVSITV
ncbi:Hypothetical protein A7982_01429 [Minicystis rosea]|nr:Hypothetical protein A7982_01429 [Minicystis rosea]